MSIEARKIQETLYSYTAILNFTPSPQGLRAKFGACSVQNAQLFGRQTAKTKTIFSVLLIQYGNEKGKVNTIIYFIVRFTKQTWLKYTFLHRKFDFRLAKIRFIRKENQESTLNCRGQLFKSRLA